MGNFLTKVSSPSLSVSGKSSRTLVWYWLRAVRSGLLMGSCPFVAVDDMGVGLVGTAGFDKQAGDGDAEILARGARGESLVDRLRDAGGRLAGDGDEAGLAAEDRQGVGVGPFVRGHEAPLARPETGFEVAAQGLAV